MALSITLPILLEGCNIKNSYGADTPDRVVEQYLLALEKKDEELMLKLIPRKYSAEQAVEDKIAQLGALWLLRQACARVGLEGVSTHSAESHCPDPNE